MSDFQLGDPVKPVCGACICLSTCPGHDGVKGYIVGKRDLFVTICLTPDPQYLITCPLQCLRRCSGVSICPIGISVSMASQWLGVHVQYDGHECEIVGWKGSRGFLVLDLTKTDHGQVPRLILDVSSSDNTVAKGDLWISSEARKSFTVQVLRKDLVQDSEEDEIYRYTMALHKRLGVTFGQAAKKLGDQSHGIQAWHW